MLPENMVRAQLPGEGDRCEEGEEMQRGIGASMGRVGAVDAMCVSRR